MRARFFLIIFSVLTIVALGATSLHGLVLKEERLSLIDQQVRDTATALLDSELNGRPVTDNDRVEKILSDELGETRIGKFFVLRNAEGHVVYESASVRLLPVREIPRRPQWFTLRAKGRFIRVLNLELPRVPDRTLQVGIVVDESLVDPTYFSTSNLSFAAFILLLGLLAAAVLTSTLLRPLSLLVEYIAGISPEARAGLPSLPPPLRRIAARAVHGYAHYFPARSKLARLREDLLALGDDPTDLAALAPPPNLPKLGDRESWLGAMYVVEGSSLGAQVICAHYAATLGLSPERGLRFFHGYGAQTGRHWREFCADLRIGLERSPAAEAAITQSAARTFETFGECLVAGK